MALVLLSKLEALLFEGVGVETLVLPGDSVYYHSFDFLKAVQGILLGEFLQLGYQGLLQFLRVLLLRAIQPKLFGKFG